MCDLLADGTVKACAAGYLDVALSATRTYYVCMAGKADGGVKVVKVVELEGFGRK